MTYAPFHDEWHDAPATDTPITAEALTHIERGLVSASPRMGEHVFVSVGTTEQSQTLTFDVAFSTPPMIMLAATDGASMENVVVRMLGRSATSVTIGCRRTTGSGNVRVAYMALEA